MNTASFCEYLIISIYSNARLLQNAGQNFKGRQLQKFKKRSKREHGYSGPENFVHPTFKISGSAPVFAMMEKSISLHYIEIQCHLKRTFSLVHALKNHSQ